MAENKKFLTVREAWEAAGGVFTPDQFITKPGPCDNLRLFMPTVTVPEYLMDDDQAREVVATLNEITKIVGPFGERRSKINTPEYIKAAVKFEQITGLDPLVILDLAHRRVALRF